MNQFWDVVLDSLIDTAKLLPILLIVYFLIEFLEFKRILKFEKSKLLSGKASPVIGALFGSVPQCGFSVISAELYSKQKISVAALISVFIATSDEALPIMIANYKTIPALLLLLASKILIAIIVGYVTMFIFSKIIKSNRPQVSTEINASTQKPESEKHDSHDHETDEESSHEHIHACCHHDIENQAKFNWKHPLIHCFKISLYIFIVNILIGEIVALIGIENIENFLNSSSVFQPLFALIVGLIPNCAASVILTEMYIGGMLSFGSIVTGLCVNAGIGIFVLLKENKKLKENISIILILVISSLLFGYALHFLPLNFLRF